MLRRLALAAGALFLVLSTAACAAESDSGLQSVRDPAGEMFFEVPADWAVYHSGDLEGVLETPFVSQDDLNLPVFSRVVFQGIGVDGGIPDSNPSDAQYPVGAAVVRTIPDGVRDLISRYWLAELVLPYHSQPVAQEELKQDISLGDGFDGVQLIVLYNDADTESDAGAIFISVTDPEVTTMYSIAVGCSLSCFNTHVESIIDVIDSWLVNRR